MNTSMAFDWYGAPGGLSPDFGRVVCILGTTKAGPIREPIRVMTDSDVTRAFGSDGTLPDALRRALDANPEIPIYGVRVAGEYAKADVYGLVGEDLVKVLSFRAIYGGTVFNDTLIEFTSQGLTIRPPTAIGNPLMYSYKEYPALGDLVRAVNTDTNRGNGVVYASTSHGLALSATALNTGMVALDMTGGEDGVDLDKNGLFLALERTYAVLEGLKIDYVVPVGAYVDDADLSPVYGVPPGYPFSVPADALRLTDPLNGNDPVTFHDQLIQFCRKQHRAGHLSHGVIGLRPLTESFWQTATEFTYSTVVLQRTAFRNRYGFVVPIGGQVYDRGFYCSVVCGDLLYGEGTPQPRYENGAVTYAAMLASLDGNVTTTAKQVPGISSQRVEFTDREIRKLAELGIVTFRTSVKYGLVVSNGVTAAMAESDLHGIGNVRMIALTIAHVNQLVEPLSGDELVPMIRNRELERRVRNLLDVLKAAEILRDYRLNIQFDLRRRAVRLSLDLLARHAVEYVGASTEMRYTA